MKLLSKKAILILQLLFLFLLTKVDVYSLVTGMDLSITNDSYSVSASEQIIDGGLVVSFPSGTTVFNSTITISTGFDSTSDVLIAPSTITNGSCGAFDTALGNMVCTGDTAADLQTILRGVKFKTSSSTDGDRKIIFTLGDIFVMDESHYYKMIINGTTLTWTEANTLANNSTLFDLEGYLATITSEIEHTFVKRMMSTNTAWIGGKDHAPDYSRAEDWYWETGPEAGTKIPLNTAGFNYWATGEPNNSAEYMAWWQQGFDDFGATTANYLVEYGGLNTSSYSISDSVLINVNLTDNYLMDNSISTLNAVAGEQISLDQNIQIEFKSSHATTYTAAVTIDSGYNSLKDLLIKPANTDYGTCTTFNSTKGQIICSADNAVHLKELIKQVEFKSTDTTGSRNIVYSFGDALPSQDTGHFYEYVTTGANWATAVSNASGQSYYGMTGYLVTITSAEENALIAQKIDSDIWIGASDAEGIVTGATEGQWYWVTGPESGTKFGSGSNYPTSWTTTTYANWNDGEPNDSGSNEDYAQFYSNISHKWNDLDGSSSLRYIIEYGGVTGEQSVTDLTSSVQLNLSTESIAPVVSGVNSTESVDFYDISTFTVPTATYTDNIGVASSGTTLFKSDGTTALADLTALKAEMNNLNDVVIKYTATDYSGNETVVSTTVSVIPDNTKPQVSSVSTDVSSGKSGDSFTTTIVMSESITAAPTVEAVLNDGDYVLVSSVTGSGTIWSFDYVAPSQDGFLSIRITEGEDGAGNIMLAHLESSIFTIKNPIIKNPIIKRIPLVESHSIDLEFDEITIEVGTNLNLPTYSGYKLYGYYKTDLTNEITVSGTVDVDSVGTYPVTYSLSSYNDHERILDKVTETLIVTVVDTTSPSIIIEDEVSIYVGDGYSLNYDCIDRSDSCIVEQTNSIDTNKLGSFVATFTAIDAYENTTEFSQIVNIVLPEKLIVTIGLNSYQFVMVLDETEIDLNSYEFSIESVDGMYKLLFTDSLGRSVSRMVDMLYYNKEDSFILNYPFE